jgi:hypothetical protein
VDAEDSQWASIDQPGTVDFAANHPAVELQHLDRFDRPGSRQEGAAPAAAVNGLPQERVRGARAECLARAFQRCAAFLGENEMRRQCARNPRPVSTSLPTSTTEEVVSYDADGLVVLHTFAKLLGKLEAVIAIDVQRFRTCRSSEWLRAAKP